MQFFFPKPSQNPNPNPSPNPFQTLQSHLSTALSRLQTLTSHPPPPLFAHIPSPSPPKPAPASAAEIGERLAGVPVYALSNTEREFMLVSGVKTGKALALMCFKKEDAEALLDQMRAMSPRDETASEVVSVALNKVIQVKVNNVAFRFIPDSQQVLNAIKVKEQIGISTDGFAGVPVFQSRSLVLRSDNKKYHPAFFRKEDLDESLCQTAQLQNQLNPVFRRGDIQVSTLEEIISDMKENSMSKWNDIVFIPPGFDMSNHLGVKGTNPLRSRRS